MDSIIKKVKLPNSSTEYGINDVRIGTSAISSPTHVLGYNSSNTDSIGSVAISDLTSGSDTKNTAGATDTSAQLFLIGATTQGTNPQTYSQDTAYVGTDGCLYSGGNKVITDVSGKADLVSPAFTGTPTAPTAASGTNNTQIATTAFVASAYAFSGVEFVSGNSSTGTHDANAMTSNGHYYYTSNGPSTSIGASTDDGSILSQAYNGTWVTQLAQDYRNGNIFVRGKNNGTWTAWKKPDAGTVTGYTVGCNVPSDAVFTDTTYSSKAAALGGTAISLCTTGEKYTWGNKQSKVSALGSTTKPVYTSAAGTFTACSTYAGGTAVTLNGSSKAASTASFYAPESAGTSGYYLKSNGSGSAPTWTAFPTIPSKMSDVATISVVAVTADTSSSCSITGSGNAGKSETIIYTNSSGSDKVVTVPTTYTTPTGEAIELTCPNGGYCEVNYLNISGTIYARGL